MEKDLPIVMDKLKADIVNVVGKILSGPIRNRYQVMEICTSHTSYKKIINRVEKSILSKIEDHLQYKAVEENKEIAKLYLNNNEHTYILVFV
ncbi:hypothetical protein QE152_g16940 [Popillia japonica]|uniref:Uncharacterized protein n=1 Tax=Popillia japonica TaxID=7064 RepID=A0AAW1L5W2_POPJA